MSTHDADTELMAKLAALGQEARAKQAAPESGGMHPRTQAAIIGALLGASGGGIGNILLQKKLREGKKDKPNEARDGLIGAAVGGLAGAGAGGLGQALVADLAENRPVGTRFWPGDADVAHGGDTLADLQANNPRISGTIPGLLNMATQNPLGWEASKLLGTTGAIDLVNRFWPNESGAGWWGSGILADRADLNRLEGRGIRNRPALSEAARQRVETRRTRAQRGVGPVGRTVGRGAAGYALANLLAPAVNWGAHRFFGSTPE